MSSNRRRSPQACSVTSTPAHAFHSKLTAGHQSHVRAMRGNHRTLTDVGDKAHTAATAFEETEAHNRTAIANVPDA